MLLLCPKDSCCLRTKAAKVVDGRPSSLWGSITRPLALT
jgi:hypothetical protein